MRVEERAGTKDGWIGFDLSKERIFAAEAGREEAQERLLDQMIGEDLLRGIRLDRVLAARAHVLRKESRAAPVPDELGSEFRRSDGLRRRLYPA